MKDIFWWVLILGAFFSACRNDGDTLQKIDQITSIYIDSAGVDMLNPKLSNAYHTISMNDVNGIAVSSPVLFTTNYDSDSIKYIKYIAGAKRIRIDSSETSKTYQSKIALILTKKVNDTNRVTNDIITINYKFTPTLFEVSQIWYNDVLKFTKVDGQPNIVKISK